MPDLLLTKNPYQRARLVFDWFRRNGGDFLYDSEQRYLLFDDVLYRLPDDPRLGRLILEHTGQMNVNRRCRKFRDYLDYFCSDEGRAVERLGWVRADPEKDTLCIHLHDEQNRILELGSGKVEYGLQHFNRDGGLLLPIGRMQPIEYIPEATPEQAVADLKRWVVDALPIHLDFRWIVVSWLLTSFFEGCCCERCMLKLSGPSGSGKTTAARLLSCLLYGEDFVETRSGDYYKAKAGTLPLLICDLPPGREVDAGLGHFINASSSGTYWRWKEKGKVIRNQVKALAIVTSVGPIRRAAAVRRAYDIRCHGRWKLKGFSESGQLRGLLEARNRILSGMFQLFARDVLLDLERRCDQLRFRLASQYGSKRPYVHGYFALVAIILRAIMGVHYLEDQAKRRTQELIESLVRNQSASGARKGGRS